MLGDLGDTNHLSPVIKGSKYRLTYHSAVVGILGKDAPRVSSRGSLFYNKDRWTLRVFVKFMCDWAKENQGCVPTHEDVKNWVKLANAEKVLPEDREIVVANTPEILPLRTALALTGGAYHEAAHTWISCRRSLTVAEMIDMVIPRWAKVADWSRYAGALLEWSNLIEDIRIERSLREEFEGTYVKLCDLQDFILKLEEEGQRGLRSHGQKPGQLNVIAATFRDIGLGYPTTIQKIALDRYRTDHKTSVDLVLSGPLTSLLKEAIALPVSDDTSCLRLAMDVISTLGELAKQDQEKDQAKNGEPGDGKKNCPNCGASAGKLKVRPKSDGKGGKEKNKGIVTCTVCGWQAEVNITPKKSQPKQGLDPGEDEHPEFEGFDVSDFDFGSGDKAGGSGNGDPNGNGSDSGSDGNLGGADGLLGDDSNPKADGAAAGNSGKDSGDDSGNDDDPGDEKPKYVGKRKGAGGYYHNSDPVSGEDFVDAAVAALNQAAQDGTTGLKDAATALQEALEEVLDHDDKLERGEKAWNPYDPTMDEAVLVGVSRKGQIDDQIRAEKLYEKVKSQCLYLRARLRSVVRSLEQTGIARGLPKGRTLSSRYLVDTKVTLMSGEKPKHAFDQKGTRFDTSMAAAVVMDQSGSMDGPYLALATKVFMAITEPIDGLGFPTLALGFRDGGVQSGNWNGRGYGHYHPYSALPAPNGDSDDRDYHRYTGITWDIFKGWNEKFNQVMWRFANTRAEGSTPMSDGIQYALMALSQRNEAHRFLFVVTDGEPNQNHIPVIRRQCRLAKEAGIHIIGVGLGSGAKSIKKLFPDFVWSEELGEFPILLVQKINDLVDIRAAKRGCRVQRI